MSQGQFNHANIEKLQQGDLTHYNQLWDKGPLPFLFAGTGDKVYANHSHEFFALKCKGHYAIRSYEALANDGKGWGCVQGLATSLKGVKEVIGILLAEKAAKKANLWS